MKKVIDYGAWIVMILFFSVCLFALIVAFIHDFWDTLKGISVIVGMIVLFLSAIRVVETIARKHP